MQVPSKVNPDAEYSTPLNVGRAQVSARGLSALMRHYTRLAAFSVPIVRRLIERPTSVPPDIRLVFDHAGSSTNQSTNLGDTITVDQTAATVANLIRYRLPEYPQGT